MFSSAARTNMKYRFASFHFLALCSIFLLLVFSCVSAERMTLKRTLKKGKKVKNTNAKSKTKTNGIADLLKSMKSTKSPKKKTNSGVLDVKNYNSVKKTKSSKNLPKGKKVRVRRN